VSTVTALLPRPRATNPLLVDVLVALALGGLGVIYLWSRSAAGVQLLGGAFALIGAALLGGFSTTVPAGSRTAWRGILLAAFALGLAPMLKAHPNLSDLVPVSLPLAIFVLARVQLARQLNAEMIRDRAARLEREQERRAREAVAEERARIARELHDVVAHSVGVMVVQAQGAERVLDSNPAASRQALRVIASTGRDAMAEMHRMVGMLRGGDEIASLAPQPNLAQLGALLDQVKAAGLPVTATIKGEVQLLSPGVELAAYRIVQEALTNARKHAGPARAEVLINYMPETLEVQVDDDGKSPAPATEGARLGVVGMRERAALYGGTLDAGPRPEGGYRVLASLPYGPNRS
jgi:signal transduction histidine kinase